MRPGGWPVCLDKVRTWGDKPDADIFLGAGAPAHEVLKQEGLIVPYRPKDWDKVPLDWHRHEGQGQGRLLDVFCSLDCHQPLQPESPQSPEAALRPQTWKELLNPIYRGNIVTTLPYASGHHARNLGDRSAKAWAKRRAGPISACWQPSWTDFPPASTDTTQIVNRGESPIGLAQPQMNAMVCAPGDGYPVSDLLPDKTHPCTRGGGPFEKRTQCQNRKDLS